MGRNSCEDEYIRRLEKGKETVIEPERENKIFTNFVRSYLR